MAAKMAHAIAHAKMVTIARKGQKLIAPENQNITYDANAKTPFAHTRIRRN
jgi:hypothetical protein